MTSTEAIAIVNTNFPLAQADSAHGVVVQSHETSENSDTWIVYSSNHQDTLYLTDGIEVYSYNVTRRIRL